MLTHLLNITCKGLNHFHHHIIAASSTFSPKRPRISSSVPPSDNNLYTSSPPTTTATATTAAYHPKLPAADGNLTMYILPVGQGDAHVIQCPTGEVSIIDMGTSTGQTCGFWRENEIIKFLGPNFVSYFMFQCILYVSVHTLCFSTYFMFQYIYTFII